MPTISYPFGIVILLAFTFFHPVVLRTDFCMVKLYCSETVTKEEFCEQKEAENKGWIKENVSQESKGDTYGNQS